MAEKKHLVHTFDGHGAAENLTACLKWAKEMGLRADQTEFKPTGPMSNYVQEYGVYTTDAGKAKVERKQSEVIIE